MNTVARTEAANGAPARAMGSLAGIEQTICALALLGMVALPIADKTLRAVASVGVPGAVEYTQHLSLWVGFFGAVIAARRGSHLSLAPPADEARRPRLAFAIATATAIVAFCLAHASWRFVASQLHAPARIGGWLPVAVAASVLPIAFALIGVHSTARMRRRSRRVVALGAALAIATAFAWLGSAAEHLVWPLVALLALGALLGLPIFAVLGGIALVCFFGDGVPAAALPVETYRLVVSPTIPAIPLFTLTGFILASGHAAERLVRLFRALLGWLPGGTAIAATVVCAFFSAFTGASGVTILALGGLLLPALRASGASERFSVGLVTSTGSIGLLFPPSLAVILYGVVAHVPIPDLFRAGALPGVLLVGAMCAFGVAQCRGAPTTAFDANALVRALWESRFELLLPVIVLVALFGGFATTIEAAAISTLYALGVETLVHRDFRVRRDLANVLTRCATLLGGVFAIIGVAMGLTNYLVDAMVPMKLVGWVASHVESRLVFLLLLNVLLLIVGCLMDIFSAIFVVLPLIIPASELLHVDPLHLAIVFLVNLEIGYLTPPVGMNLFLASYRLERPIVEIYRSVLPFLAVLFLVLVIVTFVPQWVGVPM